MYNVHVLYMCMCVRRNVCVYDSVCMCKSERKSVWREGGSEGIRD